MTEYAQSLIGGYRGSRIQKARYMYEKTVHANFIELSADHRLDPEEFRVLLENVQGVRQVTLHDKSKADQGNLGAQDPKHRTPRREHYRAHNFMVFSTLFPNDCRGMEFELTESLHMKRACYKVQGTLDRSLEAWRILRTAVSGKQLHSNIVIKFEEELKVLTNASMDKPTVFSNSHETAASMQPPPQTPTLVELQSRNDALGCAGSSSSGVGLQPGSASSSADQQVHRPLSSPASKKTLASSLLQVLDGYRNDEKNVIQVASALKLLSASTLTIIRMEEILRRPGGGVLEPIFRAAIEAQDLDHLTAVQMIAVLNEFVSVSAASPLPAGSTRSATHQLSVQPPHYATAMTASLLPENTLTLKNMNASTAKHAKWYVRILDPKIISYKFRAKEKEVNATKFQCILVSKDPSQYMLGLVAFEFKDLQGAKKAFEKFKKGTVWEISTPSFDSKSKSEYNGCPIKTVLLLSPPTKTRAIPPTNKAELDHPAQGLKVALEIKGVMALLSTRAFKASGSAKVPTKTFDFIGKITALSSQRSAVKGGQNHRVADATFVDTQGGQITVSIWNEAYDCLQSIPLNSAVVILGCSATKDVSDVKLNIWPSAHISTDGEQAQLLANLDTTNMETFRHRLDQETALVLVSAVEHATAGSASSGAETERGLIATVEDMQKNGESELKRVHSTDSEYCTQSARKLARLG